MNIDYQNDPKNDILFKYIFGKENEVSKRLLKILINGVYPFEIRDLIIKNPEITADHINEKNMYLDIKVTDDKNHIYNIEMQCYDSKTNVEARMEKYGCKLVSEGVEEGKKYNEASKVYMIIFRDSANPKRNQLVENYAMRTKDGIGLEDHCLEINTVYIKNIVDHKLTNSFEKLVSCFNEPSQSDILKLEDEEVRLMTKRIEEFNDDPLLVELAYKRKLALLEQEQLEKELVAEGEANAKREMVINLKDKGMTIDFIMSVTNLSKDEIENIIK